MIASVARQLGVSDQSLSSWRKQAEADQGVTALPRRQRTSGTSLVGSESTATRPAPMTSSSRPGLSSRGSSIRACRADAVQRSIASNTIRSTRSRSSAGYQCEDGCLVDSMAPFSLRLGASCPHGAGSVACHVTSYAAIETPCPRPYGGRGIVEPPTGRREVASQSIKRDRACLR